MLWKRVSCSNKFEVRNCFLEMQFLLTKSVILILLDVINIFIHSLGSHLLFTLYKKGNKTSQQLFLINLSVIEACINVLRLVFNALTVVYFCNGTTSIQVVTQHLKIVAITGGYYLYIISLFYITCDRLLNVLLNIRYRIYWNESKTKQLLVSTWIVISTLSVLVTLVYSFKRNNQNMKSIIFMSLFMYIPPLLNIGLFIVAVISYSYIFLKHSSACKRRHEVSLFRIFRNSHFFVSVLLVKTFFLLAVLPNIIQTSLKIAGIVFSETFILYTSISFTVSDTADGIIYIFMQKSVRKLLFQRIYSFCSNILKYNFIHQRSITTNLNMMGRRNKKKNSAETIIMIKM